MKYFIFLLSLLILNTYSPIQAQEISNSEIIKKMLASISTIKTMKYRMKKSERLEGKMIDGEQEVKVVIAEKSPVKAYIYNYIPNPGAEVLWVKGTNDEKALVNPNAFPYVNLSLDLNGAILRKGQHHTIHELGFDYLGDIISYAFVKFKDKVNVYMKNEGSINWGSRDCYKIVLDNAEYKIENYTVLAGEDVIKIARKLKVGEYNILELNPNIKNYNSVKPGQIIKVLSTYAKKTIFYIDKLNFLPIYLEMYDDKGKLAVYEYYNLLLNLKFNDDEFTKGFKGYHF